MRTFFTVTLLLFCNFVYAQGSFSQTKINKRISLDLHSDFVPMSPAQLRQKYVSNSQPIAMYSTLDNRTDLGINVTSTNWGEDLTILKELYKASILNLYDKVNFQQEDITSINGRQFIVFEFTGTVLGNDNGFQSQGSLTKYLYLAYTPFQDKILIFNFSTDGFSKDRWSPLIHQVVESIKIK